MSTSIIPEMESIDLENFKSYLTPKIRRNIYNYDVLNHNTFQKKLEKIIKEEENTKEITERELIFLNEDINKKKHRIKYIENTIPLFQKIINGEIKVVSPPSHTPNSYTRKNNILKMESIDSETLNLYLPTGRSNIYAYDVLNHKTSQNKLKKLIKELEKEKEVLEIILKNLNEDNNIRKNIIKYEENIIPFLQKIIKGEIKVISPPSPPPPPANSNTRINNIPEIPEMEYIDSETLKSYLPFEIRRNMYMFDYDEINQNNFKKILKTIIEELEFEKKIKEDHLKFLIQDRLHTLSKNYNNDVMSMLTDASDYSINLEKRNIKEIEKSISFLQKIINGEIKFVSPSPLSPNSNTRKNKNVIKNSTLKPNNTKKSKGWFRSIFTRKKNK